MYIGIGNKDIRSYRGPGQVVEKNKIIGDVFKFQYYDNNRLILKNDFELNIFFWNDLVCLSKIPIVYIKFSIRYHLYTYVLFVLNFKPNKKELIENNIVAITRHRLLFTSYNISTFFDFYHITHNIYRYASNDDHIILYYTFMPPAGENRKLFFCFFFTCIKYISYLSVMHITTFKNALAGRW